MGKPQKFKEITISQMEAERCLRIVIKFDSILEVQTFFHFPEQLLILKISE
jgi:hypothetical protein